MLSTSPEKPNNQLEQNHRRGLAWFNGIGSITLLVNKLSILVILEEKAGRVSDLMARMNIKQPRFYLIIHKSTLLSYVEQSNNCKASISSFVEFFVLVLFVLVVFLICL